MFAQGIQQLSLNFRPFTSSQAVHHGIAYGAVASRRVTAYDAVFFCAQALDGTLACEVEIVCAPTHHVVTQSFKGMCHQHEFCSGVHMAALHTLGVPGVANFQAFDSW